MICKNSNILYEICFNKDLETNFLEKEFEAFV